MDSVYGGGSSCSFELSLKRTENVGVQNGGEFEAWSRHAGWQIVVTVLSLLLRYGFFVGLLVCLLFQRGLIRRDQIGGRKTRNRLYHRAGRVGRGWYRVCSGICSQVAINMAARQ